MFEEVYVGKAMVKKKASVKYNGLQSLNLLVFTKANKDKFLNKVCFLSYLKSPIYHGCKTRCDKNKSYTCNIFQKHKMYTLYSFQAFFFLPDFKEHRCISSIRFKVY